MKTRVFRELGVPPAAIPLAQQAARDAKRGTGLSRDALKAFIVEVLQDPAAHLASEIWGDLARAILKQQQARKAYTPRESPAPYRQWGDGLEAQSVDQMRWACQLPVALRGALMPDAHLGYGLPIGGVLATENAVIPYAVGVDIACRVKMTVLDLPNDSLETDFDRLKSALVRETQFGVGAKFKQRRRHDVMDHDWNVSPITRENKDRAWAQLGTSGSGNHFVEFGLLSIGADAGLDLPEGKYLALLSHSGSRGTGAAVCQEYSKRAMDAHPELPDKLRHLAWLDLDTEDGQEYWAAMNLMGEYASANHACIHRHIKEALGAEVLLDIENHHNFAWKETHDGKEVIVHRKGATPAGKGVLGIIPGSMATPTYIVRGRGEPESLNSAAHGAGRVMSRRKAHRTLNWEDARAFLKERGVTLLSAGLDEVPAVYKDIRQVMNAQADLVEPLATFQPKLVRMAKAGERPED
jgi:tRNA-splicing ligase RtcB